MRREQRHLVPQRPQLPRPVVGPAARLHSDPRRRELGKKRQDIAPPELAPQNRLLPLVNAMQLKNILGRTHANSDNLAPDGIECARVSLLQVSNKGAVREPISSPITRAAAS